VIKMRSDVRILGLKGFPLVKPSDDIAELVLIRARSLQIRIADGDVLIIGHKIISKSEGRIARLSGIRPSRRAVKIARRCLKDPRLVQLILTESRRILKVKPGILLVETKHGIVCLNAGIDKSNVEGSDSYCLLPKNPKLSAARIAKRILERTGKRVEAIVTDTYSRPFRVGQIEFAIGASGVDPFVDYRGTRDLFGKVLKFKRVSIADELACAGELVMGQGAEGIPVAIIKGANRIGMSNRNVGSRLAMKRGRDLFRGAL
jgi:coenzyme F420-0:L-glutamate ligase/coenzyme F420-1:gamma-L-glutamate ligase